LQSLEIKDTWQPFEVRSCVPRCDGRTHSRPWLQGASRLTNVALRHRHTGSTGHVRNSLRCFGVAPLLTRRGRLDVPPTPTPHLAAEGCSPDNERNVIFPVQEGLNTLTFTRHVSVMSITLSTVPLDPTRPGYQAPLPLDQVKPLLPPSRSHPGAGLVPRHVPSCHGVAISRWLCCSSASVFRILRRRERTQICRRVGASIIVRVLRC